MKIQSLGLLVGMGLVLVLSVPVGAEVKWTDSSLEKVLEQAKTEGKHVFIDFYTVWCSPCKKLDKVTYVDGSVEAFLAELIPVKYDAEKGEGKVAAGEFRVAVYPTLMLLDPEGKEVDRYVGYLGPEDFVKVMTDFKNGVGTVEYYTAKIKDDPEDVESWRTLAIKHSEACRLDEAKAASDRYFELAPSASGDDKAEVLYNLAFAYYEAMSYEEAIRLFEGIISEFEGTDWQDLAATRVARCYHALGKNKKCVDAYMAYVERHPEDPGALNSFAWFCATKRVGLDEALPVALKAVELSGRQAGYLDTLAELYFARGEFDKAVDTGEEALEKEPGDKYLVDQLKKFKKAREEAEGQASN